MCNRYNTPTEIEIERHFRIGRESPGWWKDERIDIFPRAAGPFLRRAVDDSGYSIEGVAGQWGLIP